MTTTTTMMMMMMMIPSSHTSARHSRGLTGQMWQANNALCVSALRTDGMMHCLFCAAFTAKCTVYDVNCAVLHSKVLSFAKGVLLCSNSVECFYNSSELCYIQVQPAELCIKKHRDWNSSMHLFVCHFPSLGALQCYAKNNAFCVQHKYSVQCLCNSNAFKCCIYLQLAQLCIRKKTETLAEWRCWQKPFAYQPTPSF